MTTSPTIPDPQDTTSNLPQARVVDAPRVLFVTTNIWGTDFLVLRALRRTGVRVAMLCPRGHPVRAGQHDGVFDLAPFRSNHSLGQAIDAFSPELLVPGDERALLLIQSLHRRGTLHERRLVEASLGPPSSYGMMSSRRWNMEAAEAAGVLVPGLIGETSRAGLVLHLRTARRGIVLKADSTWGGNGVRICRTSDEIDRGIAELRRPPLMRGLKRWLIDGDAAVLAYCLSDAVPSLSAQECLPVGRVGDLALFCREGVVLGLTCAERETGTGELGPSTIVRIVERHELAEAARRFVRHYGLSGFIGLDFIVDPVTDEARVIEINPRVTPLASIQPQNGSSPALAAAAELGASPRLDEASFRQVIAYFPRAWQEHPEDPRLAACDADIPSDEPDLVDALILQASKDGKRRSRLSRTFGTPLAQHRNARNSSPVISA